MRLCALSVGLLACAVAGRSAAEPSVAFPDPASEPEPQPVAEAPTEPPPDNPPRLEVLPPPRPDDVAADAGSSDAPVERAEDDEGHFLLRAGATLRAMYDVPIYAAEAGLCVGIWAKTSDHYGCVMGLWGQTQAGLRVRGVFAAYRASWNLGRAHFGISPGWEFLAIDRATSGGTLDSGGPGASLFGGATLLETEAGTLFLEAALTFVVRSGTSDEIYGRLAPTLAIGHRL